MPSIFSQAQTADEIITKHIDAIGGKDMINKIVSQVINSDLNQGFDMTITITKVEFNKTIDPKIFEM